MLREFLGKACLIEHKGTNVCSKGCQISLVKGEDAFCIHRAAVLGEPSGTDRPVALSVLFCIRGGLLLTLSTHGTAQVHSREVLLLGNGAVLQDVRCPETDFLGWLLTLEEPDEKRPLGLSPQAGTHLHNNSLYAWPIPAAPTLVLHQCLWSESMFTLWETLPSQQQETYLLYKTKELLYLLHHGALHPAQPSKTDYYDAQQTDIVRQIHDHLIAHLEDSPTIAEMACRFPISPTALKRCFRQTYGMPIHQYMLERRLEKAARLLLETSMPVVQVALAVGYRSVSQFGVAFKRRYLCSPLRYRKGQKNV